MPESCSRGRGVEAEHASGTLSPSPSPGAAPHKAREMKQRAQCGCEEPNPFFEQLTSEREVKLRTLRSWTNEILFRGLGHK